jgi:hypothetical protein
MGMKSKVYAKELYDKIALVVPREQILQLSIGNQNGRSLGWAEVQLSTPDALQQLLASHMSPIWDDVAHSIKWDESAFK